MLTGASSWGAASQETPDRPGTVLPALHPELIAEIIKQMGPHSLTEMALTNPEHIDEIKRAMAIESRELIDRHGGNLNKALLDAAENNYPWAIDYLIQHGADVNATDA